MKKIQIHSDDSHHSAVDLGDWDTLHEYTFVHPKSGQAFKGKVFLGELLKLSGMEISFQIAPPNAALPFFHKHRENEEVYIILKGSGEFQVDETVFPVKEGSVVRVATPGARLWKNTADEPMIIMAIQAVEGTLKGYDISDGYLDKE